MRIHLKFALPLISYGVFVAGLFFVTNSIPGSKIIDTTIKMMVIQFWLVSLTPVANMTPNMLEARILPMNLDVINRPEAVPLSDTETNE